MFSGRGYPPPPPPPPPARFPPPSSSSDVGSLLCPPPPHHQLSQNHYASSQQLMHHPATSYQQNPAGYSYSKNYQQIQPPMIGSGYQCIQENQHVTPQQYNYHAYTNYASVPPPPPPPPKNPKTSSRNNNITKVEKPKTINPKMAQKYSGQGLKTITISVPGLRPQKFKICVGNHPEDIKKWIHERRKRFPRVTSAGGSTQKDVNGHSESRENEITTKRSMKEEGNDGDKSQKKQRKEIGENTTSLSNLLAGYGSSSSLSDDDSVSKVDKGSEHMNVDTTAFALCVGKVAETTQDNPSLDAVASIQIQRRRICKYFQRGKCLHGDLCKFLHSGQTPSAQSDVQRQKKRQAQSVRDKAMNDYERELHVLGLADPSHGSRYNYGGEKTITNTSLLLKLLQRDKERERHLSLQLLRYIVDCDYFKSDEKEIEEVVK